MNALRYVVDRLHRALFPMVPLSDLPREEIDKMTPAQIAEYNRMVAAHFDRKEREMAAVRRDLQAEERTMRRRAR
jgi:hypothetical protein